MMALDWLVQQRKQAVRSIRQLTGLTACSRLVELQNGERYVLRRQSTKASRYGIDYAQEAAVLKVVSPLQCSPIPYYADDHSLLLTWLEGKPPTAFTTPLLINLADQLARLHTFAWQAVEYSKNIALLDLAERCRFLWDQLNPTQRSALPFSPPFPTISPFKSAICHHDIHLANLIEREDRLYLIDWEYAAISDPALDICLFLQNNPLTPPQTHCFLTRYLQQSSFEPQAFSAKIAEYRPEAEKLFALWFCIFNN